MGSRIARGAGGLAILLLLLGVLHLVRVDGGAVPPRRGAAPPPRSAAPVHREPAPAAAPAAEPEAPPAPAATASEEPPSPAAPGPCSLAFRVVAAEDGRPLPDARVLDRNRYLPEGEPPPAEGPEIRDGRFLLEGLPEGGVEVRVGAPGRATRTFDATLARGANSMEDIPLLLAGTVRGSVLDGDGSPQAGITIEIQPAARGYDEVRVETDEMGRFEVRGIPRGLVHARRSEKGPDETVVVASGEAVTFGGRPQVRGRSLKPDGGRAGFVVALPWDPEGDPLRVVAAALEGEVAGMRLVDTARDGSYALSGLAPGHWFVGNGVSHAVVRVEADAVDPLLLDLMPSFVWGRAVLSGADGPRENLGIVAIPERDLEPALAGERRPLFDLLVACWRAGEERVDLDAAGEFRLGVPGPGTWLLFPAGDGWAAEAPARAAATAEPIPGPAELHLRPAGTLRIEAEGPYLAAVRDAAGRVVTVGMGTGGEREFSLVPGAYRVVVLRPGGRRDEVPATVTEEDPEEVAVR